MPVTRICPYCKKNFLASTYELAEHIKNKCLVALKKQIIFS